MEEKLNKKLAGWRFPDAREIYLNSENILVVFEHGNEVIQLPTQSLDACVKHLWPKYVMEFGRDFITLPTTLSLKETTLRFCQHLEKLIDGEK